MLFFKTIFKRIQNIEQGKFEVENREAPKYHYGILRC